MINSLFPGLTSESHEQATLAPAYGGLGWRRASEIARPANLAGLVAAGPKVRAMAKEEKAAAGKKAEEGEKAAAPAAAVPLDFLPEEASTGAVLEEQLLGQSLVENPCFSPFCCLYSNTCCCDSSV